MFFLQAAVGDRSSEVSIINYNQRKKRYVTADAVLCNVFRKAASTEVRSHDTLREKATNINHVDQ